MLAFVWIAGPLSGVLVQPYIGIRSDNSRISWGKRKPFMVAGAAATTLSFLALAWTKEIVHGFLGLFGADSHSQGVKVTSIVFAVALVYILDIAINAGNVTLHCYHSQDANCSNSPSCHPCFYCRQCSYPPARRCQRLGRANHWGGEYRWLPCWVFGSPKTHRGHLWEHAIQSSLRNRLLCPLQHCCNIHRCHTRTQPTVGRTSLGGEDWHLVIFSTSI